jgi:hypothetical protein
MSRLSAMWLDRGDLFILYGTILSDGTAIRR